MKTFTGIIGSLFVLSFYILSSSATIETEKTEKYLMNAKNKQPYIYEILNRNFTEQDMNFHSALLEKKGAVWNLQEVKDGIHFFRNTRKKQFLVHDGSKSLIYYSNGSVKGLNDIDLGDTAKLRKNPDQFLLEILGNEAVDYKFVNCEYEISCTDDNPVRQLDYITYRYVKVLDNRLILDNTNHVRITIGNNGQISRFEAIVPKLKKHKMIKRELNASKISKYLYKHLNSYKYTHTPSDEKIDWKEIKICDGTDSYIASNHGTKKYLIPHVTFFTKNIFANGDSTKSIIHLTMNAEEIPNIGKDDIIEYEKTK